MRPGVLVVAIAVAALAPGSATAQLASYTNVHLSYFDESGEYAVSFASPTPLDSPRVRYETPEGGGVAPAAEEGAGILEDSVYTYAARIPASATRYTVRAGGLPEDPDARSFETRPPPRATDTVRVAFLADNGQDANGTRVHEAVVAADASLVIAGGDLAYAGQTPRNWDSYLERIERFAAATPFMPAAGNHDVYDCSSSVTQVGRCGLALYRVRFTLPGTIGGGETVYAYDWGPARFIVLDTEAYNYNRTSRWAEYPHPTPGDLAAFVAEELAAHADRWTIVYMHKGPLTTNLGHTEFPYADEIRAHLMPILQVGGADLVLTGHEHAYERSWPLAGADGSTIRAGENETLKGAGTVYVVSGGGGAKLNKDWGPPEPWEAERFAGHQILELDVSPERIAGRAVCVGGEWFGADGARHACEPGSTIDSFAIVREASSAAAASDGPVVAVPGLDAIVAAFVLAGVAAVRARRRP